MTFLGRFLGHGIRISIGTRMGIGMGVDRGGSRHDRNTASIAGGQEPGPVTSSIGLRLSLRLLRLSLSLFLKPAGRVVIVIVIMVTVMSLASLGSHLKAGVFLRRHGHEGSWSPSTGSCTGTGRALSWVRSWVLAHLNARDAALLKLPGGNNIRSKSNNKNTTGKGTHKITITIAIAITSRMLHLLSHENRHPNKEHRESNACERAISHQVWERGGEGVGHDGPGGLAAPLPKGVDP